MSRVKQSNFKNSNKVGHMYIKLSYLTIALLSAFPCRSDPIDIVRKHLPIMLAGYYDTDVDVSQYWKSEKLDGIRAIWDGENLRTRSGLKLSPPSWFTESLPDYPVEGELWAGRGHFNVVQSTVLDKHPLKQHGEKYTLCCLICQTHQQAIRTGMQELSIW